MLQAFRRMFTTNRELQQIQDNVQASFQPLQNGALAGCAFVASAAIATGGTQVPHGLGRTPILWLQANLNADAVIWQYQAPDQNYLYLKASSACSAGFVVN